MAMVKVTDANHRETYIPERWLNHPELGKGYSRVESPDETPSESWSKPRLERHAASKGVDLTGTKTKADIVARLTENQE